MKGTDKNILKLRIPFATTYEVDTKGNVYFRGTNKKVSSHVSSSGYERVGIKTDSGPWKVEYVHRILGYTFLNLPENLDINHKDGDKLNNDLSNLEVVNRKQNVVHAWDNGLASSIKGEDHYRAKLTEQDVLFIRYWKKEGYGSSEIASCFNISKTTVNDIHSRRSWRHI